MRKIVIFLCFLFACVGCTNYEDPYEKVNEAPVILVRDVAGAWEFLPELTDSMKMENEIYSFVFQINDEEKNLKINYFGDSVDFDLTSDTLTVKPHLPGNNIVVLHTVDGFGKADTCLVNVVAFDNLPPVATLEVFRGEVVHSPYERILDGSKSYDRDARFGGTIARYEFQVGSGAKIETLKSSINYIFPSPGSYSVYLRVQDSNGEWSEVTEMDYDVN